MFKMTGSTPQFLHSSMADKVRLCSGQKNTVEHLFNFCQRGEKKPLKTAEKIYVKFLFDIALWRNILGKLLVFIGNKRLDGYYCIIKVTRKL